MAKLSSKDEFNDRDASIDECIDQFEAKVIEMFFIIEEKFKEIKSQKHRISKVSTKISNLEIDCMQRERDISQKRHRLEQLKQRPVLSSSDDEDQSEKMKIYLCEKELKCLMEVLEEFQKMRDDQISRREELITEHRDKINKNQGIFDHALEIIAGREKVEPFSP